MTVFSYTNALGTFTPTYVSDTHRLDSLAYPNGQTTEYDYFTSNIEPRLAQI